MNLEEKKAYFLLDWKTDEQISFESVFGNSNLVDLEIGGGRGEFLVQRSASLTDTNFLEIEVKGKRIKTILRKLDPVHNTNVRLIRRFVDESIRKILPAASIRRIYIFHPDPWPKRKHHKKRLFQNRILDIFKEILVPGGEILVSTDHPGYADWIVDLFQKRKDFQGLYPDGYSTIPFTDHIPTYFECKKRDEQEKIFYMIFRKVEL